MEEQSTAIIQRKLLETASELLVRILGRLTTSSKADNGVLDTVGIGQLQAILEELNAVWESVQDPDIRYEIATCASNVEAVLETVCDFIFRTTRRKDFRANFSGWWVVSRASLNIPYTVWSDSPGFCEQKECNLF